MTKSTITREPITHYLKIYPEFFSAVCTGVKRAELRKNDRDYRVGDTLHLMETPRGSCHQTGEFINVKITHIADVGEWMPGYVLLSIEREAIDRKASMDSEPVAYIFKHPSGKLFWALTDESNKGRRDVMPVYAAPQPAPVVPDEVTAEDCPALVKYDVTEVDEAWARGFNACRAAMLQAEPVTTANKLPETQFKQVADLYEMQFDDGRTCAFHTDAEKAVQWLNTCDGNKVQEYVKLERLQEAVSGNSPVIPDTWIPVSERNPDDIGRYWCYVEDQKSHGKYSYHWNCSWNGSYWSGAMMHGRVTHWMPLPAAPQEVKGE